MSEPGADRPLLIPQDDWDEIVKAADEYDQAIDAGEQLDKIGVQDDDS